eukprot:g7944.t1
MPPPSSSSAMVGAGGEDGAEPASSSTAAKLPKKIGRPPKVGNKAAAAADAAAANGLDHGGVGGLTNGAASAAASKPLKSHPPQFDIWDKQKIEKWAVEASDKTKSIHALRAAVDYVLQYAGFAGLTLDEKYLANFTKEVPFKFVDDMRTELVPLKIELAKQAAVGDDAAAAANGAETLPGFCFTVPNPTDGYPLAHRKTKDRARKELLQWFPQLSSNMRPFDLTDTGILQHLCLWLEGLYDSPFLSLRHTATLVAGSVLLEVTDLIAQLEKDVETYVKQHAAESDENQARKMFLKSEIQQTVNQSKKLSSARDHLLHHFKQTRCRDKNSLVRSEAVGFLCRVVSKDLSLWDDEVGKLFAFLLMDGDLAAIRCRVLETLDAWVGCYEADRNAIREFLAAKRAEEKKRPPAAGENSEVHDEQDAEVDLAPGGGADAEDVAFSSDEEEDADGTGEQDAQPKKKITQHDELRRYWKDRDARFRFKRWVERNSKFIVERTGDTDEKVACAAVRLCQRHYLADRCLDDIEFEVLVNLLLCGRTPKLRLAAANFVDSHIFQAPGIQDLIDHDALALDHDAASASGATDDEGGAQHQAPRPPAHHQKSAMKNKGALAKKKMNVETTLLMWLAYVEMYAGQHKSILIQAVAAFWEKASCLTAWKTMASLFFLCEGEGASSFADPSVAAPVALEPLAMSKKLALAATMEASLTLLMQGYYAGKLSSGGQNPAAASSIQSLAVACHHLLPNMAKFFELFRAEQYGKLCLSNCFNMLLTFALENPNDVPSQTLHPVLDHTDALESVLDEVQTNHPQLYQNACRCYRHLALLLPEAKRALVAYLREKQTGLRKLLEQLLGVESEDESSDADRVANNSSNSRPETSKADLRLKKMLLDADVAAAAGVDDHENKEAKASEDEPKTPSDYPSFTHNFIIMVERGVELSAHLACFLNNDMLQYCLQILLAETSMRRLPRQLLVPLMKLMQRCLFAFVQEAARSLSLRGLFKRDDSKTDKSKAAGPPGSLFLKDPISFWQGVDAKTGPGGGPDSKKAILGEVLVDKKQPISEPPHLVKLRDGVAYARSSSAKVNQLASELFQELNFGLQNGLFLTEEQKDCYLSSAPGSGAEGGDSESEDKIERRFRLLSEKNLAGFLFEFRHALIARVLTDHRDPYVKYLSVVLYFDSLQVQNSLQEVLRLDPALYNVGVEDDKSAEDPFAAVGPKKRQMNVGERIRQAYVAWREMVKNQEKAKAKKAVSRKLLDDEEGEEGSGGAGGAAAEAAEAPDALAAELQEVANPVLVYQDHEVTIWTYLHNLFTDIRECTHQKLFQAKDMVGPVGEWDGKAEAQSLRLAQTLITSDKVTYASSDFAPNYIPPKEAYTRSHRRGLALNYGGGNWNYSNNTMETALQGVGAHLEDSYSVLEHVFHKACLRTEEDAVVRTTVEGADGRKIVSANHRMWIPPDAESPVLASEGEQRLEEALLYPRPRYSRDKTLTADPIYVKQDIVRIGFRDLLTLGVGCVKMLDMNCESEHVKHGPIAHVVGAQFGLCRLVFGIKDAVKAMLVRMKRDAEKSEVLGRQYFHFLSNIVQHIMDNYSSHANDLSASDGEAAADKNFTSTVPIAYVEIQRLLADISRTWTVVGSTELSPNLRPGFARNFIEMMLQEAMRDPANFDVDLIYAVIMPTRKFFPEYLKKQVGQFLGQKMITVTEQRLCGKLAEVVDRLRDQGPGLGAGGGAGLGKKRGRAGAGAKNKVSLGLGADRDVLEQSGLPGSSDAGDEPENDEVLPHPMEEEDDAFGVAPPAKKKKTPRSHLQGGSRGGSKVGSRGEEDEEEPDAKMEDVVDQEDDLLADEYMPF